MIRVIFLVSLAVLVGCSAVKHLEKDEILYKGIRKVSFEKKGDDNWKLNEPATKRIESFFPLWVVPNGSLFGLPISVFFPIKLTIYNWFYTDKNSGLKSWIMKNFGEAPKSISYVDPDLRIQKAENILFNYGHFGVKGSYNLRINKNGRKAWIVYEFQIPEAYTIRKISYEKGTEPDQIAKHIQDYLKIQGSISSGNDFVLNDVESFKNQLWQRLQNLGHLYVQQQNLILTADTTVGKKQVDLYLSLDQDLDSSRYLVVNIDQLNYSLNGQEYKDIGNRVVVKKKLLSYLSTMNESDTFNLDEVKKNVRNLYSTNIFREADIDFIPIPGDSSKVIAETRVITNEKYVVSTNTDIVSKNTGFIGPSISFNATRRNLFGKAENLSLDLEAYYDFPVGIYSGRVADSYGFNSQIDFITPVLDSPIGFMINHNQETPRRVISLGFDYNNRIGLFEINNLQLSHGLKWNQSSYVSHQLILASINYTYLPFKSVEFQEQLAGNTILETSFQDQLIMGSSYKFTYDNTRDKNRRINNYFSSGVELAGNTINAVDRVAGSTNDGKVLNVNYAQYVRIDLDFRTYLNITDYHEIAFRTTFGMGKAYGNSRVLPYTRKYYIGGNNSLRPITARSVGPGRYLQFDENAIDQVGDFKIDMSLEYRFHLIYKLYGALWSDWGNIWLLEEDTDRPGSGLRPNHLFRDSYLTGGVGLRYDLGFLVARGDYGAVIHIPSLGEGNRWIWQNRLPLYRFIIGIGYPF
jgi:outer membrane protein assembly factor BamA